ncbi:TonB C-terminal domain-containing protein [Erythrobacter ani]|uniref:Energy transducer TonB n=1 Tax=Erythrobacter ani TaxID=2827235 RepID=A0ABS6SN01_9SPHN|nr:TonB C-terminal domain-containing protein [Erythrobacter ani]MBV7266211.1 energy transducer TonB [Erythrobacter ani]
MGESALLRSEDRVAIPIAVALHVGVVALLVLQPVRDQTAILPERMTVSLATDIGLEATAPDPVAESRTAIAPVLGEELGTRPENDPSEAAETPPPSPPSTTRTTSAPSNPAPNRPRPDRAETPARNAPSGGGSRVGSDFLPGSGSSTSTDETRIPASDIGPSAKASIIQAIVRQIRPHWNAPSGVDAELLVTELAFDLNEDGSLKGRPRVLRQSGENAANLAQKSLHAERAIRAVQLAAPFDLPDEYYNAWKSIRGARFDRNLSR